MGSRVKTAELLANLNSHNTEVRKIAAKKLGKRGNREAVRPLCVALQDDDWKVRRNAATSLGTIGDVWAVRPLIAALDDPTASVRKEAVSALGSLRDVYAVEALSEALKDKKESVRLHAIEALRMIGPGALAPLCRLLGTEDHKARFYATTAIGVFYRNDPYGTPARILSDPHLNPQERWQGLEAIRVSAPGGLHRFISGWLTDIRKYCEMTVQMYQAEAASGTSVGETTYLGAKSVLEYMTLARPSQRHLALEKQQLLRGAQVAQEDDSPETLLRGASAESDPALSVSRPSPWLRSLADTLRRWIGPR